MKKNDPPRKAAGRAVRDGRESSHNLTNECITLEPGLQLAKDMIFDLLDNPSVTLADLRVLKATLLNPSARQDDIAATVGITSRQVKKSHKKLQADEISALDVVTNYFYDSIEKRPKRKNLYSPKVNRSSLSEAPKVNRNSLAGDDLQLYSANFPKVNGSSPYVVINVVVEAKRELEGWIFEPTLSELVNLKHMRVEYAREWREWYYRRDYPDWMTDPAGWAVKQMRTGVKAPLQMALPADETLPAGSIELPPAQAPSIAAPVPAAPAPEPEEPDFDTELKQFLSYQMTGSAFSNVIAPLLFVEQGSCIVIDGPDVALDWASIPGNKRLIERSIDRLRPGVAVIIRQAQPARVETP